MTDASLSEALKEAYASADSEIIILHTLELRHPAFVDENGLPTAIRVVRDNVNHICRLEESASLNAGQDVEFVAMAFDLELPPVEAIPVPEIMLTLDISFIFSRILFNETGTVISGGCFKVIFLSEMFKNRAKAICPLDKSSFNMPNSVCVDRISASKAYISAVLRLL